MGEMADYHREDCISNNLYDDEDFTDYSIWVTKKGDKIEVIKMLDSHLINTIKLLNRTSQDEKWLITLETEANKRKLENIPVRSKKIFKDLCDATEIDLY